MSTPKVTASRIHILAVTPGIDPAQPILLTVSFEYEGQRVLAVRGMSLTEAGNLQAQLNWSTMDWLETRKEGGTVQ